MTTQLMKKTSCPKQSKILHLFPDILLFCQPRVEVTSCFVYKVMGLTFHDRINTPLIYRIAVAQVVTRRITKPQRTFFRFESHWLLFFIHFFVGGGGGEGGGGLILLFSSCLIYFSFYLFLLYFFLFFIPLTCIRYIFKKNFCNNTSYCKGPRTVSYSICPNFDSLWLA